jgi:serine/threonine-protein kinase
MSEALPKSLGRYEIRGVLGKGAMGLVYDGRDPNLDRRVAIKTILTSNLDPESAKSAGKRFEREVHAVARLNHPNIVQVYDFGTEADLAYIVMEFIKGRELKDHFDKGERFDLASLLRITIELLDALDFAHEAEIIHRDVKPANVMVDAGGHVKLTDFGVARLMDEAPGEATRLGKQIGTPSYMSPEQIQGQPLDRRTDIFSAGIVFYQLLTGKRPFESGSQFGLRSPRRPTSATRRRASLPTRSSASSRASRRRSPARRPSRWAAPPRPRRTMPRAARPTGNSGTTSRTRTSPRTSSSISSSSRTASSRPRRARSSPR